MTRLILVLFLAAFLAAQSAPEVDITAEPHHHLVLANDRVRVFDVDIPPHSETLLHRHAHDYIYVMLGPSEVVNAIAGKDPVTVKLQDEQCGFFSGPFVHVVRSSAQPFHNLTIELLEDDKLRHSTVPWDETRGMEVLEGGTQEILFVKDGVRVSQFELQPGGMIPAHHHAGPHLVIALTAYELRSDETGKAAVTFPMKRGETKWVAGGLTHMVTNTSKTPARFVTVEFP
jgi:quercetin dioxygenase-like cupin family protein